MLSNAVFLWWMKKSLFIFFAALYLLSSSGISLNLHYCGGKIKSVSFFHTDEADCCGPKMKKKKDCCKERSFVYQVKEDQNNANPLSFENPAKKILAIVSAPQTFLASLKSFSFAVPDFHAPPDITGPGTYLKNRAFRI